jgi:hypothetical protein
MYAQSGFRTENVQYAAVQFVGGGIDTNWCGFKSQLADGTLMIGSNDGAPNQVGYYSPGSGWMWRWETATLAAGTVPAARLSGVGNAIYYNVSEAQDGSTLALRTAGGYLFAAYFNQGSGDEASPISSFSTYQGDNYQRKASIAFVRSQLGVAQYQSAFSTSPGYMIFTNGFKVMWGQFAIAANTTSLTTTFPTAFAAVASVVVSGAASTTNAQDNPPGVIGVNTANFQTVNAVDNIVQTWWIATGY